MNGGANGVIFDAANGDKIFAMTEFMLAPIGDWLAWGMAALIVVLLLTFLVTSADSAVLIVNTINAAGDEGPKSRPHVLFWGVALAMVVAGLLISGGTTAIQTAMVIGALPFFGRHGADGGRCSRRSTTTRVARRRACPPPMTRSRARRATMRPQACRHRPTDRPDTSGRRSRGVQTCQ